MKTKECPSCAVDIDSKETVCPVCGYEFPGQRSFLKPVALLLLILFAWPLLKWIWNILG